MASFSEGERVIVEADKIDDLAARLSYANVVVPGRANGRHKDTTEIWSLVRVLGSRPYSFSDFPLKLIKRERPDFLLTLAGAEVGIEHVEAITQNAAKEAFLRDAGIGPDGHLVRRGSLSDSPKSSTELISEIEADEMSPGWYGSSVEREWVDAMTAFVVKKIVLLQKPGYRLFPRMWLVIYDNWPGPRPDLQQSLPSLRASLDSLVTWKLFDRVFILNDSRLAEIDESMIYVYCVNHCR